MEKDEIMLLSEIDQRSKSNTHRIDKLEQTQEDISGMVAALAVVKSEQEHIKADIGDIKDSVQTLAEKPAKKWDNMSDKLTWLIVGGVLTAVLTLILKAIGL